MEDFIPCLLLHPDDQYFVKCLRQERYARSLFQSPVCQRSQTSPFDRVYCQDYASFTSILVNFDISMIMKELFGLLKPKEQQLWLQFMEGSTEDVFVYHFKGESCRKFRSLQSWLYKEVISCVAFHARCFCIVFKSIDTVLEVHFSSTEHFEYPVEYRVRICERFVSACQQALETLEHRSNGTNVQYNQSLIEARDCVLQNGRFLGRTGTYCRLTSAQ